MSGKHYRPSALPGPAPTSDSPKMTEARPQTPRKDFDEAPRQKNSESDYGHVWRSGSSPSADRGNGHPGKSRRIFAVAALASFIAGFLLVSSGWIGGTPRLKGKFWRKEPKFLGGANTPNRDLSIENGASDELERPLQAQELQQFQDYQQHLEPLEAQEVKEQEEISAPLQEQDPGQPEEDEQQPESSQVQDHEKELDPLQPQESQQLGENEANAESLQSLTEEQPPDFQSPQEQEPEPAQEQLEPSDAQQQETSSPASVKSPLPPEYYFQHSTTDGGEARTGETLWGAKSSEASSLDLSSKGEELAVEVSVVPDVVSRADDAMLDTDGGNSGVEEAGERNQPDLGLQESPLTPVMAFNKFVESISPSVERAFVEQYTYEPLRTSQERDIASYINHLVDLVRSVAPGENAEPHEQAVHTVREALMLSLLEAATTRIMDLEERRRAFSGAASVDPALEPSGTAGSRNTAAASVEDLDSTPVKFSFFLKRLSNYVGGLNEITLIAEALEDEREKTNQQKYVAKNAANKLASFLGGTVIQFLDDREVPFKMLDYFETTVGHMLARSSVGPKSVNPEAAVWQEFLSTYGCSQDVLERAQILYDEFGILGVVGDFLRVFSKSVNDMREAPHHDIQYLKELEANWKDSQVWELFSDMKNNEEDGRANARNYKMSALSLAQEKLRRTPPGAHDVDAQLLQAAIALL
ncbi:hypothetical protein, conserved [Eimeria necatrix]|uniref:Uncharacterized protein n=1 Tax=Eimeria necatrix TaxID=51315 RepID=U6MFW1_9EIME|nr:hypothetical protein, conserved [Eimeria necatrix]CDJ63117.1 hypothetical protein, conserved [Eimeria necatrix]